MGEIHEVRFSPDGALLVSAAADDTLRFWDVPSLVPQNVFDGTAWNLTFSPDGSRLACANDNKVQIRSRAGVMIAELSRYEPLGGALAFSPDGALLVTCNAEGQVYLWDLASRQVVRQFRGVPDEAISPCVSVRLQEEDDEIPWGRGVYNVAFSDDASRLTFFWGHLRGVLDISELLRTVTTQREPVIEWEHVLPDCDTEMGAAMLSPDGRLLAIEEYYGEQIWLLEAQSLKPIGALPRLADARHLPVALVFSPDSRFLAIATDDRMARIWDLETQRQVGTFVADDQDWSEEEDIRLIEMGGDIDWSPDGKLIATGGMSCPRYYDPPRRRIGPDDYVIKLWEVHAKR